MGQAQRQAATQMQAAARAQQEMMAGLAEELKDHPDFKDFFAAVKVRGDSCGATARSRAARGPVGVRATSATSCCGGRPARPGEVALHAHREQRRCARLHTARA